MQSIISTFMLLPGLVCRADKRFPWRRLRPTLTSRAALHTNGVQDGEMGAQKGLDFLLNCGRNLSLAVSKVADYPTINCRLVLRGRQRHEGCGMKDFDGSASSDRSLVTEAVCSKLS
ncbi:hypothetical protein B0T18DRAFT_403772 [Schizothecium vesticola]|uniref:Uncharacterized protein n=1 Tax=Schizothecium vesticola TaxID=314040 RepID=A0AA40F689_9PEZI|nr:hypothetical protein B0T18DRAFT_403772 [Schizothecium vesticola]